MLLASFLEFLNAKLMNLKKQDFVVVHYDDLINKSEELVYTLSAYLGLSPQDIRIGLSHVRPSAKDWRTEMPKVDREWMMEFFNDDRLSRWDAFLPFRNRY